MHTEMPKVEKEVAPTQVSEEEPTQRMPTPPKTLKSPIPLAPRHGRKKENDYTETNLVKLAKMKAQKGSIESQPPIAASDGK